MKRQKFFLVLILIVGWSAILAIGPAIKLSAQQSGQTQLVTAQVLGTASRLRDFVPSLHEKPNAPFGFFQLRVPPEAIKSHGGGGSGGGSGGGTSWTDPALQSTNTGSVNYTMGTFTGGSTSFDGVSESGYVPSDSNLAVGMCSVADCGTQTEQIVEVTNVEYAIYGSSGNVLLAPAPMHTIFKAATTSMCSTVDGGDPIALFDRIDQRWIISQLAYNTSLNNNHLCIAISITSDAAGSYTLYDLNFGANFPDYPKLAVWSDGGSYAGIYVSTNIFYSGNSFSGAAGCAIPLSYVKTPPTGTINVACFGPNSQTYNLLPADLEGTDAAPSGTPGMYVQFVNSGSASGSSLNVYKFAGLTSGGLTGPTSITVPEYHEACGGGACVPQSGVSSKLDSLGDRLMYRLSYLGGAFDQMVVNHSVQISSSTSQTGVRWYVIQHPGGTPNLFEYGTFAPGSSSYRWMGSIAQDKNGDFGLGYSTSSSSAHPGLAVTGRAASDKPPYTLEPETSVFVGPGSQHSTYRWGDYTSTAVAPDGCTFWYVDQYVGSNGTWKTRIANFKFNGCS